MVLTTPAVDIRDMKQPGIESFLYSSGFRGPGYIAVKGLVGRQDIFKVLTEQYALRVLEESNDALSV